MAGLNDESIEISKFGTGLFAFAFVLVIGLTVFTVGKAITNNGSEKVQKQLMVVEQSEYSDYDQVTVLGTAVRAAYQNFEGKEFAILVCSRSMLDNQTSANGIPTSDANWDNIYKELQDSTGSIIQMEGSNGALKDLWAINYNAVLESEALKQDNGYYVANDTFKMDSSGASVMYYSRTGNMKKNGMGEYIPSGARYQSNLIKDATGQVIGVMFVQVSTAG